MYEFVDTNQAGSKSSLPSEALQIDGAYIENLIRRIQNSVRDRS